jgi:hypothetical protein
MCILQKPLKRILVEDIGYPHASSRKETPTVITPTGTPTEPPTTTATAATATNTDPAKPQAQAVSTPPPAAAVVTKTGSASSNPTSSNSLLQADQQRPKANGRATVLNQTSNRPDEASIETVTMSDHPTNETTTEAALSEHASGDTTGKVKAAVLDQTEDMASLRNGVGDGERTGNPIQAPPSVHTSTSEGGGKDCSNGEGGGIEPPFVGVASTKMAVATALEGVDPLRVSESCISVEEATQPPVPSTSFQLQTDWKLLKRKPALLGRYFKVSMLVNNVSGRRGEEGGGEEKGEEGAAHFAL